MKLFDFEQKIKNENNGNVNLIYKNKLGELHITTLKGRSCKMEVKNNKVIYYDNLEALIKKSEQYSKFESFNTFLIDNSKSTDALKWVVNEYLTIKKVKNKLSITDDDIAKMFDYKNKLAYANSSAKTRIENALVSFYMLIKKSEGKN